MYNRVDKDTIVHCSILPATIRDCKTLVDGDWLVCLELCQFKKVPSRMNEVYYRNDNYWFIPLKYNSF